MKCLFPYNLVKYNIFDASVNHILFILYADKVCMFIHNVIKYFENRLLCKFSNSYLNCYLQNFPLSKSIPYIFYHKFYVQNSYPASETMAVKDRVPL